MRKWIATDGMSRGQMLDLPPVWLLGAVTLVWAQGRLLPGWTHEFALFRVFGVVLILTGIALMIWAIAAFRAHQTSVVPHQTPSRLITSGPFARSRNPIYLGDVLLLIGVVLWYGAMLAAMLVPVFVWILTRRFIAPEEAQMKESFGADFAAFVQKTPRWL